MTSNAVVFVWISFEGGPKAIVRELFWAVFGFGWITASVLLMTNMCFAIDLFKRNVLRELQVLDTTSDTTIDVQNLSNEEILQKFVSIQKFKQTIDDNLGLLPFLWFFELFSSKCFRLTQISSEANTFRVIMEYFFEYTQLSVVYFIYIFCVNYFQTRRPTNNDLRMWLSSYGVPLNCENSGSSKCVLTQYLINCYSQSIYMAGNLFAIDIKDNIHPLWGVRLKVPKWKL